METNHVNEVAHGIFDVLKMSPALVMSWGAVKFQTDVYKNMPALKFPVRGFIFTGTVVVALNKGADLYEVYCIEDNGEIVNSREYVYFDELAEVIDKMVEKDCSQQEYKKNIADWFNVDSEKK